jgi:hypothetical protein
MPGIRHPHFSAFDNAEAISMRAYWSAASAMTGRASFAELAKAPTLYDLQRGCRSCTRHETRYLKTVTM